jgi:hypothetical protein
MMLPTIALELINEYSKPITRPDWRTFERTITKNIFFYESDNLNEGLYNIVRKNQYAYIYDMTKEELIEHTRKQRETIKKLEYVENKEKRNIKNAINKLKKETQYDIKCALAKNKKSKIRRKVNNY